MTHIPSNHMQVPPPAPRPPPAFVQATPMSKQHQALVPSIFAPLILAVRFSIRSNVCFLIPWFEMRRLLSAACLARPLFLLDS